MVRAFVGVASTVIGLVCYALSSSFNSLIGKWNSLKISAFIVFSFFICLAIMFPKVWQHWRIFHYKDHFTFLILASTTVYSFYLGRKLKTKPDAYGIISSASFATASFCISKQIDFGFLDLLYFFCGVLITQLMEIKPLFGIVGIAFTYFLVTLRSNLDDPPKELISLIRRNHHPPPQVAIDMATLLRSLSNSRSRSSHASSAIQNQQAAIINPFFSFTALPASASFQSRSSRAPPRFRLSNASVKFRSRRARALDITPQDGSSTQNQQEAIISPVYSVATALHSSASLRHRSSRASQRSRDRPARALDIQYQLAITEEEQEEEDNSPSRVDIVPSISSLHFGHLRKIVLGVDWFQNNLKMFEDFFKRRLENDLLKGRDNNNNKPLWHKMIEKSNRHLVSDEHLRGDRRTSLENIFLRAYEKAYSYHQSIEGVPHIEDDELELPLFTGTREIDLRLEGIGDKLKRA